MRETEGEGRRRREGGRKKKSEGQKKNGGKDAKNRVRELVRVITERERSAKK